jgi:hypothetical protein
MATNTDDGTQQWLPNTPNTRTEKQKAHENWPLNTHHQHHPNQKHGSNSHSIAQQYTK